uniref:Platelet glycoprotein 4 n=1 Tax=Oryzias melastigma TaxID=30732 RepID=A0A3B3D3I5_ORYME
MGCCNRRCGLIAGAVFGALVTILGGILIPVGDMIIEETVKKEATIEPGTIAYDNWVAAGAKVYRQFWFFDVQNPKEVELGGKPVLMEKGPYTYLTRFLAKENITFFLNDTASFLLPQAAIFEPSMSVGPEEDIISCLNLGVAGAYSLLPPNMLEFLTSQGKYSLFQRRTVRELLWGYKDPLLFGMQMGLFSPYNGTYDGYYNVFTGKDDINKVSQIDINLGFWNDSYCDMINGTDASSFAPFLDKEKPLYFFSSDICRSVSASYEQTLDLKGIDVYRYSLLPTTLASPVDNPDNRCFCKNMQTTKNCTLAGVLELSTCQQGAPIYISLPHFLHGSAILRDSVVGLNPHPENHKTFLDVEPITGFTLNFAKRIQVNMMYGPSDVVTILPLVWMNETATLDDETADMFKNELFGRINMLDIIQKVMMGAGAGIFVLCLIFYFFARRTPPSRLLYVPL